MKQKYPKGQAYDASNVVIRFDGLELPAKSVHGRIVEVPSSEVADFELLRKAGAVDFVVEVEPQSFRNAFGPEPFKDPKTERDLDGSWLWG